MKSFARAMHFPPIVKYIDTCVRHTFLISWHGFDVTKYVDARMCNTIVSDSGAGASDRRAQPDISVLSSSNSMHFVFPSLQLRRIVHTPVNHRFLRPALLGMPGLAVGATVLGSSVRIGDAPS
jgi:hypothetical protein